MQETSWDGGKKQTDDRVFYERRQRVYDIMMFCNCWAGMHIREFEPSQKINDKIRCLYFKK